MRLSKPSARIRSRLHPATIEGVILRDADILEQLGAIGVLRTVCKVGRDSRFPTFTAAAESLRKALATLPAQIRLDTTRALAQPKIELLQTVLQPSKPNRQNPRYSNRRVPGGLPPARS